MEEEIRKQYEIETGKKWFTVPFTHGEQAFASWGYQLWLEKKISQVEPEVKVNFADIQKEYEEKFRHLDENPKLVYSKYSISDLWEWFEQKLKEVSKKEITPDPKSGVTSISISSSSFNNGKEIIIAEKKK